MVPDEIRRKRDELAQLACQRVNWCDDQWLEDENIEGVGPGGDINPYGWYVVGTTIGGNAVVVGADDPGVYFADHEWSDDGTAEGVKRELVPLAPSIDEFRQNLAEIDALRDRLG
jgi:hypothetical protein